MERDFPSEISCYQTLPITKAVVYVIHSFTLHCSLYLVEVSFQRSNEATNNTNSLVTQYIVYPLIKTTKMGP